MMPLTVPVLDDRTFEQLFAEAKRRIPSFTPEWNNFGNDSDPGITIVQVFAFLADALLYRSNRYPDTNRLKFLQLLGVPLRPPAAASGIITISNDRGPLTALPLEQGVTVSAGSVDFVTGAPLTVLPVGAVVYYKRKILPTDPSYQSYETQYEAIRLAAVASAVTDATAATTAGSSSVQLVFYETKTMTAPTKAEPAPSVDLTTDTMDTALYIALLAPPNVARADAIAAIANETLSIGVVPAAAGGVPPLAPVQLSTRTTPSTNLIFEMPANPGLDVDTPQYVTLTPLAAPDVLNAIGVVQLTLPGAANLGNWTFSDPMSEGTEDFPPKIEDPNIGARVITWIRLRLRLPTTNNGAAAVSLAELTWVGINAAPVYQAVAVVNEIVGIATGEPDQSYQVARTPVLPSTLRVITRDVASLTTALQWAQTDDLLAAAAQDQVYTLDAEAGVITFGGITGARPPAGAQIIVNYQYGGGVQGNVGISTINLSRDPRLQGGFSVANPVPTSGGDLGQAVANAVKDIPGFIRHKDRLVTAQDFADVVMQTPGVDINRIDVLPLFKPAVPPTTTPPQDGVPGVVTLMAVPLTDPVNPLWPTPDRFFLGRICDYIDTRRLVTTEIYVRGPEYVPVYVSIGIAVQSGYFPDLVRNAVSDVLRRYLSSLRGYGPTGAGWPLRRRLLAKDLEAAATRTDGVEYVDSLQLGINSANDVPYGDFTGLQLPRLDGLSVVEGAAQPLASTIGTVVQPPQPGVSIVPVPIVKSEC
jgi:hypothetical protein